ncbi:MAG TPA: aldehyde dehydrogenase family protein [Solirubrobacteraceae bacterium]
MTTVDLDHQQLLIGGDWTGAKSGREYEQSFPFTGDQVGWAAAAGRDDARKAVDAAAAAFGEWSQSAPAMRRQILNKAADLLMKRQVEIAGIVTEETGGVFGWGMFNVELAAGMLREAAAQAYGLMGEVIPSDVPGKLAMGRPGARRRGRRDRALERARDPVHARGGDAARVREHGRAQGFGDLPPHPRRHRAGADRCGPACPA